VGLNRTGSHIDNGGGEIVIGFTIANCVQHYLKEIINAVWFLHLLYCQGFVVSPRRDSFTLYFPPAQQTT